MKRIAHGIIAGLFALIYVVIAQSIALGQSSAQNQPQAPTIIEEGTFRFPGDFLSTLKGYTPSILASEAIAQQFYHQMANRQFREDSGCFQRAHLWTHRLYEQKKIKSLKVFLFFTERYQREFDYIWNYHVAPMIPTLMDDGRVDNLVFDPTFTSANRNTRRADRKNFDEKPIPLEEWIKYFVLPNAKCPLIQNFKAYEEHQEQYYCYTMIAPMYNYLPEDFDEDAAGNTGWEGNGWYNPSTQVRTDWRIGDLLEMENSLR